MPINHWSRHQIASERKAALKARSPLCAEINWPLENAVDFYQQKFFLALIN